MNRCRLPSKRYTAMERCPSFAFFSGLGPTMKDAVTTNLHLKCCPARPPAYAALRFLHTNPSAFALCIFFTKSEKNEKKKDDGKDEDGDSGEDEEGDDADGHEDHDGHGRDDGDADG